MTLISPTVGVDHRDLDAVAETNCVDAHLAIVVTIIGPFDRWSIKNPRRISKGDAMPAYIDRILRWIPREPNPGPLRNVCTNVEI